MKKKLTVIISVIMMICLLAGTQVFASDTRENIYVGANKSWKICKSVSRSAKYYDAYARAFAVYPTDGGTDNYQYLQVALTNTRGTLITNSEYTLLKEYNTTSTSIRIKNGYLATTSVIFKFRGNSPNCDAFAYVQYNGN